MFNDQYNLGRKLGKGAFSVVKEVTSKGSDPQHYAAKVIKKSKLSRADKVGLRDEIAILKSLKSKHIIKLYDFFYEEEYVYIITELMLGGELFDRIVTKTFYNEKDAKDVCKILFTAIAYCHDQNVAHRDLKPENLLLVSKTCDKDIKIADFGFAKKVIHEESLFTQCGTPEYVAPEILRNVPYGTKADMWSLGVIIYTLLGGYPPFYEEDQMKLFKKIKRGSYTFHEEYWSTISVEAKEMIAGMLTVNPRKRLNAKECLASPWMKGCDETLSQRDLALNLNKFKRYNAKRKVRQAVFMLMATNKITSLGYLFRTNIARARKDLDY